MCEKQSSWMKNLPDLNQIYQRSFYLEVSKIKIENCIKEQDGQSVLYAGVDGGKAHMCYSCNKQFQNVLAMLNHLHTSEHKEHINPLENDWMNHFKTELKSDSLKKEGAKKFFLPVKGVEFVKSFSGFFCTLCTETLPDVKTAERHLLGHEHSVNYKNYIKDNPLYEKKCLFKTYVNYSASAKEKRKRDDEKKEQQCIKRKKVEETDEKVKEMLNEEKSKEMMIEELEEVNTEASGSKNQKTANIKLILSSEKEKKHGKTASANEPKTTAKFVYIGKAPNFKNRPKPWYKREIYAEKNEDSGEGVAALGADTLKITAIKNKNAVPKSNHSSSKNKSDTSKNIASLNPDAFESEKIIQQKIPSKKELAHACLAKEEQNAISKDNSTIKSSKKVKNVAVESESLDIKITESNEETKQYKDKKTVSKEITASEIKDPIVNRAIKNILYGNDSSLHQKDIPVSEIKLPKSPDNSSKHCFAEGKSKHFSPERKENKPVPMDISPVRNSGNISLFDPNRKTYTEEEKDFLILGINKDDFRPLAIPVPPPPSVLGFYNVAGNATIDTTVPPPNAVDTSVPPPGLTANKIDTSIPPPMLALNKIDTSVPPPVLSLNTYDISVPPPIAINTTVPPPAFPVNVNQGNNFRLPSQTGFSSPGFPRSVINKKTNLSNQTRVVFEQNSQSNLITIKPSKEISDLPMRNTDFKNKQTGTNLCNEESKIFTKKVKKVSKKSTVKPSLKSKEGIETSFTKKSDTKITDADNSIEDKILKCEQGASDNSTEKDTSNIEMNLSTDEFEGPGNTEVIDEKSDENAIESCINDLKCSVEDECESENAKQIVGLIDNGTTDVASKSVVTEVSDQSADKCINVLKVEKNDSIKVEPLAVTSTGNIETDGNSNMQRKTVSTSNNVELVISDACLKEVVQNQKTPDNYEYNFNAADNTLVGKTLISEQNVSVNNESGHTEIVLSPLNDMNELELKEDNIMKEIPQSDVLSPLNDINELELKDNIIPEVPESAEFTESTNQIRCENNDINETRGTSVQSPMIENPLELKFSDNQEGSKFIITEPSSNDYDLNLDSEMSKLSSESQTHAVPNVTVYETEFRLEDASKNCNEGQSLSFMPERKEGSASDQFIDINSRTGEETSVTEDSAASGDHPVLDVCLEEELSEPLQKCDQSCNDSISSLNTKLEILGMKSKAEVEINNELSSGNSEFLISDEFHKELDTIIDKSESLKFVDKDNNNEITNISDALCIENTEVSKCDSPKGSSDASVVIHTQELKPVQSTISEFCEENNIIGKHLLVAQASSDLRCSEKFVNATEEMELDNPDVSSEGISGSSLNRSDVCSAASMNSACFEKMDIDILCQQNSVPLSGSVTSQKSEDENDISEMNIESVSSEPKTTGDKILPDIVTELQASEPEDNNQTDTTLSSEFQEPEAADDKKMPEIVTKSGPQESEDENDLSEMNIESVSSETKATGGKILPDIVTESQESKDEKEISEIIIKVESQEPEDNTQPDTRVKLEPQESKDKKEISRINIKVESQEPEATNEILPEIVIELLEPEDNTQPDTRVKLEPQESEDEDISEINIKPVSQEPETNGDKTLSETVARSGSQGFEDIIQLDDSLNPEPEETDLETSCEIIESVGLQDEAIKSTEIACETSKQPEKEIILIQIDDSDTDEYENEEQ